MPVSTLGLSHPPLLLAVNKAAKCIHLFQQIIVCGSYRSCRIYKMSSCSLSSRLMATLLTAVESSISLRLWSSRTRYRVCCLSPTATRGGGRTPSTAPLVFFHSRSLRRRPNLSSWISRTFQIWPMLISTHRTPTYK